MNDRYDQHIDMSHSVNVHKTRTNNQLSLTKTIVPGGKDQVSASNGSFTPNESACESEIFIQSLPPLYLLNFLSTYLEATSLSLSVHGP